MGKIIFFDIDGTLVSASGTILDSTRRAIALARENGHKTLINTGRTFQNVDPEIRELGFDGVVCGCGTHVILDGKTLFYQTQSAERCAQIAACCRDCQVSPLYERRDLMFYDPAARKLPGFLELETVYEQKKAIMRAIASPEDPSFWFDKFVIWYDAQSDLERFHQVADPEFFCIDRGVGFAELVPHGYTKASGMQVVLDALHADSTDTLAIGDSLNDLEMLQAAQVGICMGNSPMLEPYADYVTAPLEEDGLFLAMQHFGLF